jgi:hypothetical protein
MEDRMTETILVGRGTEITTIATGHWKAELSKVPERMKTRLSFMTRQHHQVRYFVVRNLPRIAQPISPDLIATKLKIPLARVKKILVELEENLFFLLRDSHGHVAWAFPVTSDKTRHPLLFSTGEQIYAA